MGNRLKPDDRSYQRGDKEQSPEAGRVFEENDAHQRRTYGAYAGPYGVGRAYRQGLGGFDEQQHADRKGEQESAVPPGSGCARGFFGFSQAGGKGYFK